jgi:predicted nuclease of predicted toxin-antitoxin system
LRFLADENVERQLVAALRDAGHDVEYIAELAPGSADEEVLQRARRGSAVIITGDKDFGELVYRRKRANAGVVLLRLRGLTAKKKLSVTLQVFADHSADFVGTFSVITETGVRVRQQG